MKYLKKNQSLVGWVLSLFVVIVSSLVWLEGIRWNLGRVSSYRLFPLLGLLAFGLMWTHYIVAALKKITGSKQSTNKYFEATSFVVLVLILAHPGMLVASLWRDGYGLPPRSYLENYIPPGLEWAALLGSISLLAFLAYELRRWYKDKSWWKYIQYAADIAMFAILIHGFKLGNHLDSGWFQVVWAVYLITYIASLGIIYMYKPKGVRDEQ